MADVDIDPFGEHESGHEEPTDECIPLTSVGGGVQTWDPRPGQSAESEQETSFADNERKEELVRMLQLDIFGGSKNFPDDFHFDKFELRNDQLYCKENDGKPLTTKKGELRTVKELVKIERETESSRISEDLIMDMKDIQTQTDDLLPMQELLGLDAQLRSIRGSLKVEIVKKVQLEERIKKEQ